MRLSSRISACAALFCAALIVAPEPSFSAGSCDGIPPCVAPAGGSASSNTETVGFLGLQWNFGSNAPELILGLRHTNTQADDRVYGGKVDLAFPLGKDLFTPTVRVLGLAGNVDFQGELGMGIDTRSMSPLLAIGLQVPYANLGANYVFGDGFRPYVGFNSLERPSSRAGTGLSCPPNYVLIDAPANATPQQIANGKTCRDNSP